MRVIFLVAALLGLCLGCEPKIPEGRFTCATDADCPPDLVCRTNVSRCYATPSDEPTDGG